MSTFLKKTEPGNGEIGAESLVDGEVIVESITYAEYSSRRLVPVSQIDRVDFTWEGPFRREP